MYNMTKFKVALYGDSGVGKSSLLARLFRDVFVDSSQSTIGASFMTWRPTLASGKKIFIGIWDTAGQEGTRSSLVQWEFLFIPDQNI